MINFFKKLWLNLRVGWSNLVNKSDIKQYDEHCTLEFINVKSDLRAAGRYIDSNYEYTYDSPLELFDSMHSPAYCFSKVDHKDSELKDDCDGFHAAAYHYVHNKIECALLTYLNKKIVDSHTILVCKKDDKYYLLDYTTVYEGTSVEDVMNQVVKHRKSSEVVCWNLVKYNYETGKFYIVEKF